MKIRKQITPGDQAYNGYIFDKHDCKRYNTIQRRINAFIKDGRKIPEYLLNESHFAFQLIVGDIV